MTVAAKEQAKQLLASVTEIPLDLLDANPLNPRKTFDEAALKELAASVRQVGFTSPLLVRPAPNMEGLVEARYEIIAGHRRSEVASLLGLEKVPCIVRELSDAEAADLALIDNLQRADVPALEEAQAFNELLTRYRSIGAVAAQVGKDVAHIAKRLKLCTLTVWSQNALRDRLITVDHALLLARLGEEEQNAALKWALDRNAGSKTSVDKVIAERIERRKPDPEDEDEDPEETGRRRRWDHDWEPETVQRLREHIEAESGQPLSRAPWDLNQAGLLPDVPACTVCPQNTKANLPLFGDLDIAVPICADGGCFKAKTAAFVQIQTQTAAKQLAAKLGRSSVGDVQVLRVSWKLTGTVPRQLKDGGGANPAQLFKAGQWVEAKKTCQHSVLASAVTVDWSDANSRGYMGGDDDKPRKPGEILAVCIESRCSVHPKAYERQASGGGNGRATEAAQKAAEEKRRAEAIEESKMRMAVASAAVEAIIALPAEAIRAIALGAGPHGQSDRKIVEAVIPGFKGVLQSSPVNSPEFAKALALVSLDEISVEYYQDRKQGRADFVKSIHRLGYKGPMPWDKPAKKVAPKKAAKSAAKKAAKKTVVKKAAKR